jgi:hypothetical protein
MANRSRTPGGRANRRNRTSTNVSSVGYVDRPSLRTKPAPPAAVSRPSKPMPSLTPGGRQDRFTPQRPSISKYRDKELSPPTLWDDLGIAPTPGDVLPTRPDPPGYGGYDLPNLEAPKFLRKDPLEATQRAAAGRPYYTAQALTEMMGIPHAPHVEIIEVPPGYLTQQGWLGRYTTPGQIEVTSYPTPLDRSQPLPSSLYRFEDGSVRAMDPFDQNLMNTGLPYGSQVLAHEYAHHNYFISPEQERQRYDAAINDYLDRLHRRVGRIGQHYWDPHTQGQSFQQMLNWFPGFDTYRPGWGGAREFWAESLPWAAQHGLDAIPLELQKFYAPYISSSFDPVVRNIPFNQADSGWPWGFPVELSMGEGLGQKG